MDQVIEGICCSCQGKVPVKPNPDADECIDACGEAGAYVMADHIAFGEWCEGAGTVPQALIKPKAVPVK